MFNVSKYTSQPLTVQEKNLSYLVPPVYTIQRSSGKGDNLEEFVIIIKILKRSEIIHGKLDMEIV